MLNRQKKQKSKRRKDEKKLIGFYLEYYKKKLADVFQHYELQKIARESHFIQRSTSLLEGKDFVELMTVASLDPQSVPLSGLCGKLREINPQADLTPQSLMERINRPESTVFLKAVFQKTLEAGLQNIVEQIPPALLLHFPKVYVEDCTECTLNERLQTDFKGSSGGASKSSVKLDFIYEVTQKTIFSVELTDRRSPDQKLAEKHLTRISKGHLWIRDLGFFDIGVLQAINAKGAYFLSRLHASAHVYLNDNDEYPIDLAEYLNRSYPDEAVIDIKVYVTAEKLPCRLIAYRAPQELAAKRRRETHKQAKKKGRTPKQTSINRLDFTFFITNVPVEVWEAAIVGTVYTVRWQVELIFKNWKSSLKIDYLRGIDPHRIRCLLYGKLILIVVINMVHKISASYACHLGKEISLHKIVNWLKVDNKLSSIILKGFSRKLFDRLMREIPKILCKDERQRKTTHRALNECINYQDLYAC